MQIFSRQTLVLALLLSIGCVASGPSSAVEVYKYVDSKGQVHLTDRPTHDRYQLIQKAGKKLRMPRINFRDKDANRKRFASKIAEVASRYQVPEALIHAVITIESAYDPNAISRAGAVGLMQLMPATAKRYGVANRRNPSANLHAISKTCCYVLIATSSWRSPATTRAKTRSKNSVTEFRRSMKPGITCAKFCNSIRSILPGYPATSDQHCFQSKVDPR
jgi:hypothetical protein